MVLCAIIVQRLGYEAKMQPLFLHISKLNCTFASGFANLNPPMISTNEYIQLKAFARQDGFFLGVIWTIMFASFVASMYNPAFQVGYIAIALATPFILFYYLKHYRDRVLKGSISFRRAFAFTAFTMAYASIILAGATLVYFYFLDNGTFISTLKESLAVPEVRKLFTDAGADMAEIDRQVAEISHARPIDIAISTFSNCILLSIPLSLVLALMGRVKVPSQPPPKGRG